MSKHTPGEWTYNEALGFVEAQDDILALTFDANAADARLMAAAPDLLEALKLHDEWCRRERQGPVYPEGTNRDTPGNEAIWREWFYGNVDLCRRAEEATVAAIAKAESR